MRRIVFLMVLAALACGAARAQQEPAAAAEQDLNATAPGPPVPDKDGVYRLAPEIAAPVVANAVPATYPPDATESDHPRIIILSVVVGIDGVPTQIKRVSSRGGPYEESAIAAVQQCRFQPGTLNGKPVPVMVHVRVPFFHLAAAVPRVQLHYAQTCCFEPAAPLDPLRMRRGDTPPRRTYGAEAEYSEQARRQRIQGVVIVSLVVTAEGTPSDMRVEQSLGHGLDEKALESVSRYKFAPALRDGKPVPVRINVEINFKLY